MNVPFSISEFPLLELSTSYLNSRAFHPIPRMATLPRWTGCLLLLTILTAASSFNPVSAYKASTAPPFSPRDYAPPLYASSPSSKLFFGKHHPLGSTASLLSIRGGYASSPSSSTRVVASTTTTTTSLASTTVPSDIPPGGAVPAAEGGEMKEYRRSD